MLMSPRGKTPLIIILFAPGGFCYPLFSIRGGKAYHFADGKGEANAPRLAAKADLFGYALHYGMILLVRRNYQHDVFFGLNGYRQEPLHFLGGKPSRVNAPAPTGKGLRP